MEINQSLKIEGFFDAIKNCTIDLLKDLNGIHVIQKIITSLPEINNYIYEILYTNFVTISTNKNGCCALQKCLEFADKNQKNNLIELIIKNSILLMTDQFGNYVIQYLISLQEQILNEKIINSFCSNIEYLSKQKYASNVIEKVKNNFLNF